MNTVFLAWRDPIQQMWYPVGRLTFDGDTYRFAYTKGADALQKKRLFLPVQSFPRIEEVYESKELFPVFANRLLPSTRPEYEDFLSYLGVNQSERKDLLLLLERSGGRRATDTFEVFALPDRLDDGTHMFRFFAHGLRHLPNSSLERINQLKKDNELLLVLDIQNPHDSRAIMLRTNDTFKGDRHFVGFCPRYMCKDVYKALVHDQESTGVVVEGVNLPPAPMQFRLRCRMTVKWPAGFQPFADDQFLPIVTPQSSERAAV